MGTRYEITTLVSSGVQSVTFSPDDSRVYASLSGGRIAIYDVGTGTRVAQWKTGVDVGAISVSDDGHYLLAAGQWKGHAAIVRFDTATGEAQRFSTDDTDYLDVQVLNSHQALVSGGENGLRTFDLLTGEFSDGDHRIFNTIDITRTGRYSLAGLKGISDGPLYLYDGKTGGWSPAGMIIRTTSRPGPIGDSGGFRESRSRPAMGQSQCRERVRHDNAWAEGDRSRRHARRDDLRR